MSGIPARPPAGQPAQPQDFWRSLDELAGSEAFDEWLKREHPRQAAVWDGQMSRRQFLRLMAASLALAGLGACGLPPREQIVPYVRRPEPILPGEPLFFATAMPQGGYSLGLLVESHQGRPTKVEGNPDHPASLGATDAIAQAAILGLYDPDRAQGLGVRAGAQEQTSVLRWETFWTDLEQVLARQVARGGAGLRLLTETVTSPALAVQLAALLERWPGAVWHQYQPINRDNARAGSLLAFGQDAEPVYHFDQADVILALDADFLGSGPGQVRYARDFAARRRLGETEAGMNRLYVAEPALTITGAAADHRQPVRASQVEAVARALAAALGLPGFAAAPAPVPEVWLAALAADLQQAAGRALVLAGPGQPPAVHALAHVINAALGSAGSAVTYIAPVAARPEDETASLRALVEAMNAGQVEMLLIIGGNPVYNSPADFDFATGLANVAWSAHLSEHADETSAACRWHLPASHFLEDWGDVRAYDGTATVMQPLIAPLHDSISAHELLSALAGDQQRQSAYQVVQAHWYRFWQQQAAGDLFDTFWRTALHDGLVAGTAAEPLTVALQPGLAASLPAPAPAEQPAGLEIAFRPDPALYDGRYANNAWLQELPRPITKLTWDNALLIGPATAERLGLANEDVVALNHQGRALRAPVWVMPGHAPDSATLYLGSGRWRTGSVGDGVGFNAYALRPAASPWTVTGVTLDRTAERRQLATTQLHHNLEGRNILRAATLAQLQDNPEIVREMDAPGAPISLYPDYPYPDQRWGMVIDLSACTGCNACVVACQAENNVPVVGKDQVRAGREMHWLRVDSYFAGPPDDPAVYFQPVPCMHCEKAPCEPVCPVTATTHSADGLNEMVYGRCIGTRYCANNCPYKVRRFNFLDYTNYDDQPSLKMLQNPDVTVRSRGVMEKCTYCVQRIRGAQALARREERPMQDGDVITACQGVCPAQAITFGDLNDPASAVARRQSQPHNYAMLGELNTRPRTTYLAAVRNPNRES